MNTKNPKLRDYASRFEPSGARTNYDIALENARPLFLGYDQDAMIRKFHLAYDDAYLYIRFVGRDYRIDRKSAYVEYSGDAFQSCAPAGFNEVMTIYAVLGYSEPDCRLAGNFVSLSNLKFNSAFGSADTFFRKYAADFDHHIPELDDACRRLGGERQDLAGDTAWRLAMFDFLPVILQFWESDEDFPANAKILWDENILSYMHFETIFYAANHLLGRIAETMDK